MIRHHSIVLTTVFITGLTACNTEPPQNTTQNDVDRQVRETHQVCSYDDDSNLQANRPIDQAETWVLIDSASEAPQSIDLDAFPEDDFVAPFALTAFLAPSLSDVFSGFNVIYACTSEMNQLNQCNWSLSADENGGEPLSVATTISASGDYLAQVNVGDGASAELLATLAGTVGDLGNIVVTYYDEGVVSGTRQATRSANGAETVTYTSDTTTWVMQESSGCNGSLDFDSNEDGEVVTVDANWTFNGQSMSGNLTYFKTGLEGPYEINF